MSYIKNGPKWAETKEVFEVAMNIMIASVLRATIEVHDD